MKMPAQGVFRWTEGRKHFVSSISPSCRNGNAWGIGTGILKDLVQESRHRGVKLHLRVTKGNRALGLYLRLRLEIESCDEMSWHQR
jgi:hypothetical protein